MQDRYGSQYGVTIQDQLYPLKSNVSLQFYSVNIGAQHKELISSLHSDK